MNRFRDLITDLDHLEPFLGDATGLRDGIATGVVHPESTEEVADLLREATRLRQPVTVAGAGTGLSGGRIPEGGIVLATDRLRSGISCDPTTGLLRVAAGYRLDEVQQVASAAGRLYPPDPTEPLALIGGNLGTNASGARTYGYGPTRTWVAGLTVVLASGDILRLSRGDVLADHRRLVIPTETGREIPIALPAYEPPATSKNAAGYHVAPGMDAVDLFVGSEGTLGVITEATLRTVPEPPTLFGGLLFFEDEVRTIAFVETIRENPPGRGPRCIEFLDGASLDAIRGGYPVIPEEARGGAIWFELEEDDLAILEEWDRLMRRYSGLVDRSLFGIDPAHHRRLRAVRHAVPTTAHEILASRGTRKFGTDIAVPHARFGELFRFYRRRLADSGFESMIWGHIGNAHLHVNIIPKRPEEEPRAKLLYDEFVEKGLELGGTVSAEHGIGKIKREYLLAMVGRSVIEQFAAIRRTLDPAGILGEGTMFVDEWREKQGEER